MCGGFVVRAQAELGMMFEDVLDDVGAVPDVHVEPPAEAFWRHGKGFKWGNFHLTFKRNAGLYGGFQGTCYWHKGTDTALYCKKFIQCPCEDFELQTLNMIKAWCVSAPRYNRKRLHLQWPDKPFFEHIDVAQLEVLKDTAKPDFNDVMPDSILDEVGEDEAPSAFAQPGGA
jgi:hypothetical protein